MDVEGKRVLLTGATGGVGRVLAVALAEAGARSLFLSGRREDILQELREHLRSLPVYVGACDLAIPGRAVALAEAAMDAMGGVDMAIACAGIAPTAWGASEDDTLVRGIFQVNLFSVQALFKALLPPMLARRRGHLVGIGSLSGRRGFPGVAAYASSKAALRIWMEARRQELRGTGVEMTLIEPGFIDTPILAQLPMSIPGTVSPERAAQRIVDGIQGRCRRVAFPRSVALSMEVLRVIPTWVGDRLVALAMHQLGVDPAFLARPLATPGPAR